MAVNPTITHIKNMTKEERTIETEQHQAQEPFGYILDVPSKVTPEMYKKLQRETKDVLIQMITDLQKNLYHTKNELKRLRLSLQDNPIKRTKLEAVCEYVANSMFKTSIRDKSRLREVINGRRFYYAYLRENTNLTLQAMANTLETTHDHGVVLNSLNKHADYMYISKVYRNDYKEYCERVEALLNSSNTETLEPIINAS